ncbi:unnamed protein product [Spirodela intermedia]|uniref:SBP-type domain-containing protein n=1 Tax=Spirodela intermedia TaxID=51605 RepID=A0A7I8I934_SPIIN|nr:unnamed protein product [Spirodela intermedia]CAA6654187.1 unnamed protein product [Spirodela intermedia]
MASWEQEDGHLQASSPPSAPIPHEPFQESSPGSSIQTSTTAGEARTSAGGPSRVRKRDPRLACENFLAGRVPCACPELDRKAEEEEEQAARAVAGAGRKKVRTGGTTGVARCQVPGCGADIRELKGYHRRHRVCLRCANASSVLLDGELKRYCQQCGKFHVLPDFDEGKRSCRRKLERHNRRRRRRSVDHNSLAENEKEPLVSVLSDVACEDEPTNVDSELSNGISGGLNGLFVINKTVGTDTSLEPEDRDTSPGLSVPSFHTIQSNNTVSFVASDETQTDEKIEKTKSTISSSFCENKSNYSSMCPTGRVSFKLYDWNPAEFPRRLRHQIFQWLSSMPVELEGYIRPGCTILTLFIAMPQSMWDKLSKESATYINDLVKTPKSLFSGRGNMLIYLNNKVFQVMKDGTFLANIKMEVHGPKIHYVYPNCFEAGKSMEFIVCGSNLLRHKFRGFHVCSFKVFMTWFAIGWLKADLYWQFDINPLDLWIPNVMSGDQIDKLDNQVVPREWWIRRLNSDHQMLMIRTLSTEADIHGPGFIEVRSVPDLCRCLMSSQTPTSDLLIDSAWLLKKPTPDKNEALSTKLHIRRFNGLLEHLLRSGSSSFLENSLDRLEALAAQTELEGLSSTVDDPEFGLFVDYLSKAKKTLHRNGRVKGESEGNLHASRPATMAHQHASRGCYESVASVNRETTTTHRDECYPLLASDWQQDSWLRAFPGRTTGTRLALLTMVMVITCCGVCVAFLHPHRAGDFMITVRRCLFGGSGGNDDDPR